jgi:uncharacterized protein YukE
VGGIDVDPTLLAGSGNALASEGDAVAAALQALQSALLSSGQMCGHDHPGQALTISYSQGGQALFSAGEAAVNTCRRLGYGLKVSAHNYALSEAASTVGGGEPSVPQPSEPAKFTGPTMPSPFGPAVGEPFLWSLVRTLVGSPWPDGNPGTLRVAAAAWRAFGTAMTGASGQITACSSGLTGQQIPESGQITNALTQLAGGVQQLTGQCQTIASELESFASEVESSQNAIRDLLDRLSVSGILDELGSIFQGHNPWDDIKQVADDIAEILHTLKREVEGIKSLIDAEIGAMDALTTQLQGWLRNEFTQYLGNDVGNPLATVTSDILSLDKGILEGLVLKPVSGIMGTLTDPEALGKTLLEANPLTAPVMFAMDPEGTINQHVDQFKELVDAKDWTGGDPFAALGNNLGTVGSFFIPGAGEGRAAAEAGAVAGGAERGAAAEGGAAGDGLGGLTGGAGADIAAKGTKIGNDLNGISFKPTEVPIKPPDTVPAGSLDPGAAGGPGTGRAPVDSGPRPTDGTTANPTPAPTPREPGGPHSTPQVPESSPGPDSTGAKPPVTPDDSTPRSPMHESPAATGAEAPVARAPEATPTPAGAEAPIRHQPELVPANADVPESVPAHANTATPGSAELPTSPMAASAPHTPTEYTPSPPSASHTPIDTPTGGGSPSEAPHNPAPEHTPGGPHDPPSHGDHPSGSGDHSDATRDHEPSTDSSHDSDDGDAGGHSHDGHASSPWDHNVLTDEQRDEILATEKGSRPDPSDYLPREFIEHHLHKFDDGASRFMTDKNYDMYGIGQRDGTSFMMPSNEVNALIESAHGDPVALARSLGLPEDYFVENHVVRVDIPDPQDYNLRVPSGNEAGANEYWLPGGFLPDGVSEAVIDGGAVPDGDIIVTDVTNGGGRK